MEKLVEGLNNEKYHIDPLDKITRVQLVVEAAVTGQRDDLCEKDLISLKNYLRYQGISVAIPKEDIKPSLPFPEAL